MRLRAFSIRTRRSLPRLRRTSERTGNVVTFEQYDPTLCVEGWLYRSRGLAEPVTLVVMND